MSGHHNLKRRVGSPPPARPAPKRLRAANTPRLPLPKYPSTNDTNHHKGLESRYGNNGGTTNINTSNINSNTRPFSRYEGSQTNQTFTRGTNNRFKNGSSNGAISKDIKKPPGQSNQDGFLSQLPKGPKKPISRFNNGKPLAGTTSTSYQRPMAPKKLPTPSLVIQKSKSSIYERIIQVGEGTYGKVYKARNTITGKMVALKRLRLEGERDGFPITSIREIKLLQSFDHPNISTLKEIMVESQKTVYMIFEYADNDLSGLLLNKQIDIGPAQCKHIFKQLLLGIQYLHENGILHRDIKGSNILIDNKGQLRITDFGLARKIKASHDYTNRVITLWYRPPELLLGSTTYGFEVDMWGCGCVLIEMFNKSSIFQGQNELEQLDSIFKIMGTPSIEKWPKLFEMPWFFMVMPQQSKRYHNVFKERYGSLIPSENCIKLIEGLLDYNQRTRLTATQALQSEYFKEDPKPEPLSLEGTPGCHEYEVKLARKQKRAKDVEDQSSKKDISK